MAKTNCLNHPDGFANRESEHGNAVKLANKPNFDRYYEKYPN